MRRSGSREGRRRGLAAGCSVLSAAMLAPVTAVAQQTCVYMGGSTICPAFNQSYISTGSTLQGYFPFLRNVTSSQTFDNLIQNYVNTTFAQQKFQGQSEFGCSNVNLTNSTNLYARYTYSFICNSIIQLSLQDCGISAGQPGSQALCSRSCSDFAMSEQTIISSPELCGTTGPNAVGQLRADFENCAQPADALDANCIPGYQNEADNCGFQYNLEGLCQYCNTSALNDTDSCCVTSDAQSRCSDVHLPTYSSMPPLFTTTTTAAPSATGSSAVAASPSRNGLSGGQIAGIVVGSVVGALAILGLIICCCLLMRRRKRQREQSSLNQPTPPMSRDKNKKGEKFAAAPGARVTRMAALEASSRSSSHNAAMGSSHYQTPTDGAKTPRSPAGFGAIAISRRDKSTLGEEHDETSPESQGYSSGDGAATGQSEQMDAFKDYYSNDDIHPGDTVSTLWAYSPRANDEFDLERGDMLRIVGIWDDGWATGVRLSERAEDWEAGMNPHRDSGVSGNGTEESPPANGEVKAFPLVCVCMPQHWSKTIEGDAVEPDLSDRGDRTE